MLHLSLLGLDMDVHLLELCMECANMEPREGLDILRNEIVKSSPSTTLYTLEVCVQSLH